MPVSRMPAPGFLFAVILVVAAVHGHAARAAAGDPEFLFDPSGGWQFDFDFYPTGSAVGDLDADGRLELVVCGRNLEGLVAVFPGVPGAGGPFGPPRFVFTGVQANAVRLHDLNADGVLDMVLAVRSTPGRVAVLFGAGDGAFAGRVDLGMLREASDVVVADLDADGDPDLSATGLLTGDVVRFRNDGAGGFAAAERVPLGLALRAAPRPLWIAAGDLDGDERPELLASHSGSGHVSILTGGEGPARRIPLGTPVDLVVSDVDGDGRGDVTTATWGAPSGDLTILAGGADGAFTRFDTPLPGFYLWAVVSSDLDGDGRPEALVTEALTGLATIMPNRSRPGVIEFGVPQPFSAGSFPWDVLSEDLDFDCDRDLVICDIAQHRVSWLLNLTPQAGCGALDLDGDGRVGTGDLLVVLREWGRGGGVGDVDRDGTVGPLDLLRMTARLEAIR